MKKFYEETLEDLIYENSKTIEGRTALCHCGLDIHGKMFRQVVVGHYGRTDLMTVHINGKRDGKHRAFVTVYELKLDKINRKVVFQTAKYIYGLKKFFETSPLLRNFILIPKAVIIGSYIEDDAYYEFINALCPSLEIYTYEYKLTGLQFVKAKIPDRGDDFDALNETVNGFDYSELREFCDYLIPDLPF